MGRVIEARPGWYLAEMQLLLRASMMKPVARQVGAYQLASAFTRGLFLDGDQVGVIGFYPVEDGVEECFFACRPAAELAGAIVPLQRAGRLIIHRRLHHPMVRTIVAWVSSSNTAGQRLARLAGFEALHSATAPGGFERWEMTRWPPSQTD